MADTADSTTPGTLGPDYFFRAADEASLQAALATMGLWTAPLALAQGLTGGYRTGGFLPDDAGQFALDVVGTIQKPTKDAGGNVITAEDGMGNPAPVYGPIAGFHANLRWLSETPLSPEVLALVINPGPVAPVRVFG